MVNKIAQYWKAIVAAVGAALLVWNQLAPGMAGVLPVSWQHPIAVVVGVLTVVSTYTVPNADPPGKHEA